MKIDEGNYKQFSYFVLLLIAISFSAVYLINYFLKSRNIITPFFVELPSMPAVYALLFYLFDKYFWKWGIFRKFKIIIAEDLSGEWEGISKSSYDNFKADTKIILKIGQTATKIKINGVFDSSKSVSFNESFAYSEVDNNVALFYFYRNEPNCDAEKTMAMHEGCVKLVYDKAKKSMEGSYYSGRDRNNYGTIKVSKK